MVHTVDDAFAARRIGTHRRVSSQSPQGRVLRVPRLPGVPSHARQGPVRRVRRHGHVSARRASIHVRRVRRAVSVPARSPSLEGMPAMRRRAARQAPLLWTRACEAFLCTLRSPTAAKAEASITGAIAQTDAEVPSRALPAAMPRLCGARDLHSWVDDVPLQEVLWRRHLFPRATAPKLSCLRWGIDVRPQQKSVPLPAVRGKRHLRARKATPDVPRVRRGLRVRARAPALRVQGLLRHRHLPTRAAAPAVPLLLHRNVAKPGLEVTTSCSIRPEPLHRG